MPTGKFDHLVFCSLLKAKLTLARPAASSVARKASAAATVLLDVSLPFAGSTRGAGVGVVLFSCGCWRDAIRDIQPTESSKCKHSPVTAIFRFIENFLGGSRGPCTNSRPDIRFSLLARPINDDSSTSEELQSSSAPAFSPSAALRP